MLSSIHPLGERARHNRWGVTVTAYTLSAGAVGAAAGAVLGWTGSLLPFAPSGRRWMLVGAALGAGILDLARVRPPGPSRQVNERWIGQFRGWVYGAGFGAQLGIGFATFVVTWGVLATYVAALAVGAPASGAIIGGVFGAGRAVAPLAAGIIDRPSRLTSFHRRMAALGPPVRIATGIVLVSAAVLGAVI
ncbi:MAG: hypothetical protein Q8Q52_07255 [Acidimicrobiia bacterium]|nr:hypothetical protein [Acidimicrobiia bacterium]